MALVNYATREINAKIVYYGPGLSGKTTNIQSVYEKVRPDNRGKLISLSTQGDRTLFFDFLPVELGKIKGFRTRFHLYTVPGQVFYNSTRKLVLKGADGVVFVADSQSAMMNENIQSLENLRRNLSDMGINAAQFPIVIQYNKRDLPDASPVREMEDYLNPQGLPYFEASAVKGDGVFPTLTAIVKYILHELKQDPEGHQIDLEEISAESARGGRTAEDIEKEIIKVKVAVPAPDISLPDQEPEPEPQQPEAVEGMQHEQLPEPEPQTEIPPMPLSIMEWSEEDIAFPEPEAPVSVMSEPAPEIFSEDIETRAQDKPVETVDELLQAGPSPEPPAAEPVPELSAGNIKDEVIVNPVPEAGGLPVCDRPETMAPEVTGLVFTLPVRIRTRDGETKEVILKVSLDVELSGEGADATEAVEVLPPAPAPADRLNPIDRPKPIDGPKQADWLRPVERPKPVDRLQPVDRPKEPPSLPAVNQPSARVLQKKNKTVFQKFFGH